MTPSIRSGICLAVALLPPASELAGAQGLQRG
jgi:hypothetical protein